MTKIDLVDLACCLKLLQDIFGSNETMIEWLTYKHPSLGAQPLLALADGKISEVYEILSKIKNKRTYD